MPKHDLGPAIWMAIAAEGLTKFAMESNGLGYGWKGLYLTGLQEAHSRWRLKSAELSDTLKLTMMIGVYASGHHGGRYYAKAQNLSRRLRAAYDEALSSFDVLLLPTTPITAPPISDAGSERLIRLIAANRDLSNTQPFNCTGHPAISVPCGLVDGLPIGMMLVAKHLDEALLYRVSAAFEDASGGSPVPRSW